MPRRTPCILDEGAMLLPEVVWRRRGAGRGPDSRSRASRSAREIAPGSRTRRAEYASVASFARATLELCAVGAPVDLVEACQRARASTWRARACVLRAGGPRCAGRAFAPGESPPAAPREADRARGSRARHVRRGLRGRDHGRAGRRSRARGVRVTGRTHVVMEHSAEDEAARRRSHGQPLAWAMRAGKRPGARRCAREALPTGTPPCLRRRASSAAASATPRAPRAARRRALGPHTRADAWTGIVEPLLAELAGP